MIEVVVICCHECHVMCPSCATPVLGSVIENHPCKKITDSTSAMGFHWTCHSAICKRNQERVRQICDATERVSQLRCVKMSCCVVLRQRCCKHFQTPSLQKDHSKDGMRAYQSLLGLFHVRSRGSWCHLRPHFNPNIHPHIERACGSQ